MLDEDTDDVSNTSVSSLHGLFIVVTLKLESSNSLWVQVDTGAQRNVIPLALYKDATKDITPAHMTQVKSSITAYGGTTLLVGKQVVCMCEAGDLRCPRLQAC